MIRVGRYEATRSQRTVLHGDEQPVTSTSRSYLFALVDGGGTVPPELGIVRRLVARGHRVTVLAEESMADQVGSTGAAFVPWTQSWGQFEDWQLRTPARLLRGMVDEMLLGPAPAQAQDTLAALDRVRPDLVLTSFPALGAMIAAESAGVPFDVVMPNVYALPAEGMPPFGVGLSPARGPLGRQRDRAVRSLSTRLFDRYSLERINHLRAGFDLDPLAHSWDQLHKARRELVLTSPAFDFPASVPVTVRYVGPILDDPPWAESHRWMSPPGRAPLVLVALSSTFQDQTKCLTRIAAALGTLPVRGVLTTGPAISPEAVPAPKNVTVVAAAPHHVILPQASVVVTHGGHGTVVKALAAGVPLVILPHGRDQADNAVRVTTRGAGMRVSRGASPTRIARAVTDVANLPRYRRAARELGAAIRHDVEASTLMAELENVQSTGSGGSTR
jgi:MGT family glycosyltransferase